MSNPIMNTFLTIILIPLAICVILCLYRAIRGPRTADRIVASNMMGTLVITIIAILAVYLQEGYLVDICIIYAMISFLAVIVLTKVYMGVYQQRKELQKAAREEAAAAGQPAEQKMTAAGQPVEQKMTAAGQSVEQKMTAAGQPAEKESVMNRPSKPQASQDWLMEQNAADHLPELKNRKKGAEK